MVEFTVRCLSKGALQVQLLAGVNASGGSFWILSALNGQAEGVGCLSRFPLLDMFECCGAV